MGPGPRRHRRVGLFEIPHSTPRLGVGRPGAVPVRQTSGTFRTPTSTADEIKAGCAASTSSSCRTGMRSTPCRRSDVEGQGCAAPVGARRWSIGDVAGRHSCCHPQADSHELWSSENARQRTGRTLRTTMDQSSPLAAGVGPTDVGDVRLRRHRPPARTRSCEFPEHGSARTSPPRGKAKRMSMLAGASVVSDEPFGDGRVVSFSIDPNFRAWTLGTDRMLWNAITGPDPASTSAARLAPRERRAAVDRAQRAERRTPELSATPSASPSPRSEASDARARTASTGTQGLHRFRRATCAILDHRQRRAPRAWRRVARCRWSCRASSALV